MDDWNDFRLILAISRSGSLTGAAQGLGINHSTAFRRLNTAEERMASASSNAFPGAFISRPLRASAWRKRRNGSKPRRLRSVVRLPVVIIA
ncbi:LysR family transcriptional regulator [Dongia soli]|uniref:helix-turn-helix domain-containing protein n=1 Tax=Dongia soli TaxID=600628 RepID=UPI003613CD25